MLIFSANIWGMHTPFWRKSFEGGGQLIHTWGGASNIGLQLIGGETSLKGLKTTNQIYKFSIHLFAGFSIAMCECRRVRILHLLHRFLHLFCREIRGVASRIVVYNPSSPWWEIAYLPEHWAPIYLSAAMSQISNFKPTRWFAVTWRWCSLVWIYFKLASGGWTKQCTQYTKPD